MKLATLALVSALVAVPAIAQPIYIDIGTNFGGGANKAAGATTTGWLDELQFKYRSWSTVVDTDNNNTLNAGDVITSTGGVDGSGFNNWLGQYGSNSISSFIPQDFGGFGPSDNGFKSGWEMTFGFTNLTGTLDSFGGVNWQSGTISFYATTNIGGCVGSNSKSCLTRLFDMEVTTGGNIPSGTVLSGYMTNFNTTDSFNGVLAADVFNINAGGVAKSFKQLSDELALQNMQQAFTFRVDQNVAQLPAVTGKNGNVFTLASAFHDGSLSFAVSEPTTLAVMGLGLMGLFYRRRSQKA